MLCIYLLFCIPFMKRGIINNNCKKIKNHNSFFLFMKNTYSNELPITKLKEDNKNENLLNSNLTLLLINKNNNTQNNNSTNENYYLDGFDKRYNFNYSENMNNRFETLYNFIVNSKKKDILYLLESNNTSVNKKLSLIENLYDFQEESIYTPNIFNGGFWKDSDFII